MAHPDSAYQNTIYKHALYRDTGLGEQKEKVRNARVVFDIN
jgi:hypothetical protein